MRGYALFRSYNREKHGNRTREGRHNRVRRHESCDERFASDVGCRQHVRFCGHRDDASRWLALFDVFCLASSFEGMSNSVMEAMSAGIPVIASDIPANRELVVQGETGFLPKLADTVGYMQFLRRMIDEPGLATRLGQAGRERIRQSFDVPRMVNAYAAIYRELLVVAP